MEKNEIQFVADFETTTELPKTWVWAWASIQIGNYDNYYTGTTIESFFEWCASQKDNIKCYFHNLKFDGHFIISYLLKNGFKHIASNEPTATKTFKTCISDKGLWYSVEVIFWKKGKKINKITFIDSLKLIPLSVDQIAKSFKFEQQKLSIDYDSHNVLPYGSPLTTEEKDYIRNDVEIVARAIDYFHSQGLDKMTIGSCALEEYKKTISINKFKQYYPVPDYDSDVRQSYRGGFTYLNPKFEGKIVNNGIVLDVNSLYPSVMYFEKLPYGTPIYFDGEYKRDIFYPLYTQMIRCSFEIKKNKIPTIQIKNHVNFRGNEYLTSSNDEEVVLCLTNVDLKLFLDHYNVYNIEYIGGWKFKGTHGLFEKYIDKWSQIKINAKKEGNHGLYLISKLYLNSLYGKFGTATIGASKIPYLSDNIVKFKTGDDEERDPIYIAMASFITSYARNKTIRSAQKIQDDYYSGKSDIEFIYADTDSLHCVSKDFKAPEGLDIDSTRLGAWDLEGRFCKAKFLRQKCYMESHIISDNEYIEGKTGETSFLYGSYRNYKTFNKITVAGMPKNCYKNVTYKNFKVGGSFEGKLQPKVVEGGVILNKVDFTIKQSFWC